MPDYSIDFKKVDAAFQHLADNKDGNAALDQLSKALDHLGGSLQPKLNAYETKYLLTNLIEQRQGAQAAGVIGGTGGTKSRVKSGFLIKTAVPE
ncbi:MAG: hypothetical protein QOJ70_1892 [Acidobacteriota bacterium]|jgi:hypothetical protein|nr:hypothetical protein [Acidobacteriota bacterium]